jgi:hypothetical protein
MASVVGCCLTKEDSGRGSPMIESVPHVVAAGPVVLGIHFGIACLVWLLRG